MLRGAISGFGEVAAQAHLAGWRTRPEVAIVAIHDPVAARRHHAINLIKNIRVYDDLDLMLDGEALDFVDVASPPAFHVGTARKAIAAGVHVIVEKPACFSIEEWTELVAMAGRGGRVLMCVHNWKHAPAYRQAHELIAAGRMGELRYLSMARLRSGPAGAGGSAGGGERWRLDAKTGGGILIDHGWHTFYLAYWLMGGRALVAVSGWTGQAGDSGLDEAADLRINYSDSTCIYLNLSWRSPVRRTSALLYGTQALLEIEGDRVILTDRSGTVEDLSVRDMPDDSYHAAWFAGVAADFERALADGPESAIVRENQSEVRAALALTGAARQSAAAGGHPISIKL